MYSESRNKYFDEAIFSKIFPATWEDLFEI